MNSIDVYEMLKAKKHITIDIVGDSVTFGTDHCTNDETYTAQFAKMLANKYENAEVYRYDGIPDGEFLPMKQFSDAVSVGGENKEFRIDVIRNGIGGNTVRRAINRMTDFTGKLANGKNADITVFMFGINDALKSDEKKYVLPQKFAEDYRELLDKFIKSEKSEIVIMSATTNDQTIDEHVNMTKIVAHEYGFLYVDQNEVWNMHYDESAPNFGHGDWLSDTSFDACHPTPKGAYKIAEKLFEYVN